jgi:hypothetical protein
MLKLAHMQGKITHVPHLELLREPHARKGFLEREKFEELLGALPSHLRPLVVALYYCGMRFAEALSIEWPAVDLVRGVIRLDAEDTKNSEGRVVPMPAQLVHMLSEREPKRGPVFEAVNIRKEWQKGCASVGLGTITPVEGKPYDPKYTGSRCMICAGAPRVTFAMRRAEGVCMKITATKRAPCLIVMRLSTRMMCEQRCARWKHRKCKRVSQVQE